MATAAATLLYLAGLHSIGEWMVRRRLSVDESWHRVCSFAVGGISVGLFMLLMGLAPSGIAVGSVAVWIAVLAGIVGRLRRAGEIGREIGRVVCAWRFARWVTVGIVGGAFLYALAPANESDGMRYHLGALSEWMKAGRIVFLPHLSFAQFPFLVEMLWLPGVAMAPGPIEAGIFAKAVHWGFFVASLDALGALFRQLAPVRLGSAEIDEGARVAQLLYASTPSTLILAGWSFIDHGLVFFFLMLMLATAKAIERAEAGHFAWAGVMAGGLIGTKYTMLIPAGLAVVAVGLLPQGIPLGVRIRGGLLTGLLCGAVALPWFAKNMLQTGNPVYPIAGAFLPTPGWSAEASELLARQMDTKGRDSQTGLRYAAWELPWRLVVNWKEFEGQFLGLMPLLAIAASIALAGLGGRPSRAAILLAGQGIAFALLWWVTYQSARMLLPLAALGALAVGALVMRAGEHSPALWTARAAVALHMIAGLAFAIHWMVLAQPGVPLTAVLGLQRRETYLARTLNYYAFAQEINQRAGLELGGALLLGEHRPYYFEGPILFSDWFNPPLIGQLFEEYETDEALFAGLKARGIEFIYLNGAELRLYYTTAFAPRLGAVKAARFEALVEHLQSGKLQVETPAASALANAAGVSVDGMSVYRLP